MVISPGDGRMAKRKRNTGRKTTDRSEDERRGFRRNATVWLATLSTVIGVATGMFTLRDQVFPRESGTAVAVSVPAYQQKVGQVCDALNEDDRRRARQDKAVKRELQRAKTTMKQRNALLDGVRVTATRSGHTFASFTAIEPPPTLVAVRRRTEEAWARNLARLRNYGMELDRSRTRREVLAALERLTRIRPALSRDGDTVRSGLQRLGEANCDLEPPIVTRAFTLPPLPKSKPDTKTITTPPPTGGSEPPPEPTAVPPPATSGPEAAAPTGNTPPPTTAPSGNTPPPTGGGGGGGD
jgi:hypothetical protein